MTPLVIISASDRLPTALATTETTSAIDAASPTEGRRARTTCRRLGFAHG
jgi:hypothetical protein